MDPLLVHIERSQLRSFGHLIRMPPKCLPLEVFQACPLACGRPKVYISHLVWKTHWDSPRGTGWVAEERDAWATIKS